MSISNISAERIAFFDNEIAPSFLERAVAQIAVSKILNGNTYCQLPVAEGRFTSLEEVEQSACIQQTKINLAEKGISMRFSVEPVEGESERTTVHAHMDWNRPLAN